MATKQVPFESRFSRGLEAHVGGGFNGEALQEMRDGTYEIILGLREHPVAESEIDLDNDSAEEIRCRIYWDLNHLGAGY